MSDLPSKQPSPSEMLHQEVGYEGRGYIGKARVVGLKFPATTMSTSDGTFPSVRFLMRCEDGKERWTDSFADRSRPLPCTSEPEAG